MVDGYPSEDPLTSATAEATVTIRDVNDEPPSFDRKEYSVSIPENAANGTPLPHLDMTVTDSDVVCILFIFIAANSIVMQLR